ncbi:MAG: D-alanyl-D-alanine carboxypeptidase [Nitrospirae bacterium]|nr:D-alanyl-D-alanine carboxypeptidase [Nitrospirota bacterium]
MKKHFSIFAVAALIIFSLLFASDYSYAAKKKKGQTYKKQTTSKSTKKTSGTSLHAISRNPYLGAIVINASDGKVLFEDNPDALGYPASMVKMMNFLIILEALEANEISLKDKVKASAEIAGIGGSEVYLRENEVHTVDDLIYAVMIKSANDAAAALAVHYAGSESKFVELMNKRAKELGMNSTTFYSVHGLPMSGRKPDVSTPRDITKLCLELLKHPDALKYTSTKERLFRANTSNPILMRNHNHLVMDFEGCDGLKTGYFRAAGFSIAATAVKNGARAIAVIFGSVDRNVRDMSARNLLSKSLSEINAGITAKAIREDSVPATMAE